MALFSVTVDCQPTRSSMTPRAIGSPRTLPLETLVGQVFRFLGFGVTIRVKSVSAQNKFMEVDVNK